MIFIYTKVLDLNYNSGKKWKTCRRIITPSFHDSSLLVNCIDTFNKQLDIGLKSFQNLADQKLETNLYSLILAWTLAIICGCEHDRLVGIIHKFTRQVIKDCISKFSSIHLQHRMTFFDTLIAKMNDEQMSIDDIQEEGPDTTATVLNFALFMIAFHQDIQQQNDNECTCTLDDIIQMDYLERIIKEALRILPSVSIIGREIQETFQYKKFDPDRFLPKVAQQQHPYAYIPFSAGSQNCIGQRFALLEAKVFLSTIIHRFHLTTS
ncbi:unnamed protein product [Rotaria sordida]|uniref:Cytochrome P450 n=1 Tax=Rotaria sordida TaxID=392033 RepID=A0A819K798_9BILA|nr:unnamed protein product [Rotaria sordida]